MFDAIHHVAYVVPDLDRALELFHETLGMKPEQIWASEERGQSVRGAEKSATQERSWS